MRKFKVNSGRITGINGLSFGEGCIIDESKLRSGHADILVQRGRLTEIESFQIDPNKKIKLAIVTSVWGRVEIVQLFQKAINNLIEKCTDFEIKIVVSGSIQNDENIKDKGTQFSLHLTNLGNHFKYIEIPNEPLFAKVNASTYACKDLGVDYVFCVGSDDLISPELLNSYIPHMRKGIDFIGVTDCYFYDTVSGKSIYWGGYLESHRKGQPCGAFRALSSRLMKQLDWMPWGFSKDQGLDSTMSKKLSNIKHSRHIFSMKLIGVFGVDIKSETNITKFQKWNNSEFIDSRILLNKFPYIKP